MKLENYELHLPSYSVGKEVYNQIGKRRFLRHLTKSVKMRRTAGWILSEKKFTEQTARMRQ